MRPKTLASRLTGRDIVFACGAAALTLVWWTIRSSVDADRASRSLAEAVQRGDLQAVRRELRRGANPGAPVFDVHTGPLTIADYWQAMLHRSRGVGPTVLMYAAVDRRPDIANELLTAKADPFATVPGFEDFDALMCAARSGDVESARLLLDRGRPLELRNFGGETVLMRAASNNRLGVLRLLLARGADPNARDHNGNTPLVYAVREESLSNNPVCVRELLRRGADPRIAADNGTTALTVAQTNRRMAAAALLQDATNKQRTHGLSNHGAQHP